MKKSISVILIMIMILTNMITLASCRIEFSGAETNDSESQSNGSSDSNANDSNVTDQNRPENSSEEGSAQESETEANKILDIHNFSDGLALFKADSGYGYMDATGKIVIDPQYEIANDFNTLAKVKKNGEDHEQYINKSGQTVYAFTGAEIEVSDVSNGYFWVETMKETVSGNVHTMTYYDQNGNKAFSIENAQPTVRKYPEHNMVAGLQESKSLSSFNKWGYAVVTVGEYQKFIDTKGNVLSLKDFGLNDFAEDYKVTRMVGNYVTINYSLLFIDFESKSAKVIGDADSLSMYIYDLMYKHLNNDYYAQYSVVNYRSSESNDTLNHKVYRYILKNNKVILDLNSIKDFGGAAVVDVECIDVNGKSYLNVLLKSKNNVDFSTIIDMDGNVVMAPSKDIILANRSYYADMFTLIYMDYSCYDCCSGLLLAQDATTGKMGYVDVNGTFVISPAYSSASAFQIVDSVAVAVVNGNTIINDKGEIIFSAQTE